MTTSFRKIETPTGSKIGEIWEASQVLGVSSYLTQTGNQPNDFDLQWKLYVDINVPPGTTFIVPAVNYWCLAHGSLDPSELDPLDDNFQATWKSHDRPYGIGMASVAVVDVNEVDDTAVPPAQTAQLLVMLHLADYNLDDPWFGVVGYTLTFYGPAVAGTRGPPPRREAVRTIEQRQRRVELPVAKRR